MKIIKYTICTKINIGTEEAPEWVERFNNKSIKCPEESLDKCLEIVTREAYNAEYTIEDDNVVPTPTQLDIIEAQVAYTAMMTGTLLEV